MSKRRYAGSRTVVMAAVIVDHEEEGGVWKTDKADVRRVEC